MRQLLARPPRTLSRRRLRILLALVAGGVVFAAGFAFAGSSVVTLTATGPQPSVVTVAWGDTVSFVNGDSVTHGVSSPDPDITATTLTPGQTYSIVFKGRTGKKPYVEVSRPTSFYGPAVIVTLSGSLTLGKSSQLVEYGHSLQLHGKLTGASGSPVTIAQRPLNIYGNANGSWTTVAGPFATAGDGSFTYGLTPSFGVELEALAAAGQLISAPLKIFVKPALTVSARRTVRTDDVLTVVVHVRPPRGAATVQLELHDRGTGDWRPVDRSPVRFGVAKLRWKAAGGRERLRVEVLARDVAAGLTGVASPWFLVTVRS
jgi:hypothetical protein